MKLINKRLSSTFGALLCFAFTSLEAFADLNPVLEAQIASEALGQAAENLEAAESATDRIAALSETILAYELGLTAMRDGLRSATIRERVLSLEFENSRDQLSSLLGVLQTLERATTPLLLIHPTGPVGSARSGMMMSQVTPSLQTQAEELRTQLEELAALKDIQIKAEQDLRLGLAGAQQARVALSQAVSDRTKLPKRLTDDPIKTQILADNSDSLTMFASSIGALPQETTGDIPVPFTDLKGNLHLPVSGTLLRQFNETDAAGLQRPGVLISARPLSLVIAPAPATVRFSGPFLDYGIVAILEPDADYLVVLAGLDRVFAEAGEIVEAGDPIGLLGGSQPAAQEFLIEASEGGGAIEQETLYIEIRINGEPVDPEDWFAISDS